MIDWIWDIDSDNDEESPRGWNDPTGAPVEGDEEG